MVYSYRACLDTEIEGEGEWEPSASFHIQQERGRGMAACFAHLPTDARL